MLKRKDNDLDLSAEEDAYKDLIASSSSDEANASLSENEDDEKDGADVVDKKQQRIEEMRRKLLGGLSEDKPKKFVTQSKDLNSDDDVSDDVSDGVKEEL